MGIKKLPERNWPGTIALAVLILLSLVLAMLDPSCQYRGPPGGHSIRTR